MIIKCYAEALLGIFEKRMEWETLTYPLNYIKV